jgi:integrase
MQYWQSGVMEANYMTPEPTRNTVSVFARHKKECKNREHGATKCKCPKYLLIYEHDQRRNKMKSAHTDSWATAKTKADGILAEWDPKQILINQLSAKKEVEQTPLVDAVALYCAELIRQHGDNGTVAMARSLFGYIDPETKAILRNGHLFNWLATFPITARPAYVADITPTLLSEWRNSWKFGSDLTSAQRWSMVKGFFGFCEAMGWIPSNPARKLKSLKAKKGNRTAIFTDEQYEDILDAVAISDPENVPAATRKSWQQRLTTFVELLRWSGMDLIDAVQYRPEIVDKEGVLRYRRQKTGVLATVPLPEHVVALLRNVPIERDSVGPEQPFRSKDTVADSDTRKWQHRLANLFKLAEITEVRTDHRTRTPHAKMLRDTFAVGHLRNGVPLHSVAKMMGHTKTETTERSYLPWVKELDEAHIASVRKALAGAKPKSGKPGKVIRMSNR